MPRFVVSFGSMSTATEIEEAIRALPRKERDKLVEDLPAILPELDGDAAWDGIINDSRPRPALTKLGDEIEARVNDSPSSILPIRDRDFDDHV